MTSFEDPIFTGRLFDRDSENLLENEGTKTSEAICCIRHCRHRLPTIGQIFASKSKSKSKKGPHKEYSVYTLVTLFLLVILFISTRVSSTPLHYKSSDNEGGVRTLTNYYSALGRSYQSRAMLDKSLVNYSNRSTPSYLGERVAFAAEQPVSISASAALDSRDQSRSSQTVSIQSRVVAPSAAVAVAALSKVSSSPPYSRPVMKPIVTSPVEDNARPSMANSNNAASPSSSSSPLSSPSTVAMATTSFSSPSGGGALETQFLRRSSRTSTSRSRQTTSDDLTRRNSDGFYRSSGGSGSISSLQSSNSGFGGVGGGGGSGSLGHLRSPASPSNFLKEPRLSGDSLPVCSHVGDYTNEISAKAYLAGTVFEGKARSKSRVMNEGTYAVTFVVQRVHKDQTSRLNPTTLKVRSQVRLNFSEKPRTPKFAQCDQSYDLAPVRPGEFVRAHIKQGRRYIVFVNGVGPHNYTVLGEPVLQKKKTVQAVKDVLCPKCVRPVSVEGLRDLKLKVKEQLTLVCKCKGNPLPILQWYKDGVHIRASKRTKIQYKKRRSLLVIPKVQIDDAGKYECRGISVTGGSLVTSWATVTVHSRPDNTTMLWPLLGGPCPIDSYCLNGGTCTYYETVGEPVCQCAEGFNGQRCESKDVYNRSSMYKPSMAYNCKLGFSSTYYC